LNGESFFVLFFAEELIILVLIKQLQILQYNIITFYS